jgi:hypothetical protein
MDLRGPAAEPNWGQRCRAGTLRPILGQTDLHSQRLRLTGTQAQRILTNWRRRTPPGLIVEVQSRRVEVE